MQNFVFYNFKEGKGSLVNTQKENAYWKTSSIYVSFYGN